MAVLTPMQRQYQEIKKKHQDALLFFRIGDFYELFYDDAVSASKILGITLTARHKKSKHKMPMCGVPFHSADKYIAKLIQTGKKVAICEQVSDPNLPGIVRRDVARIITPGTIFQDQALESKENNFVVSIAEKNGMFGIAAADITTGEFKAEEIGSPTLLKAEIFRIHPKEIILPKTLFSLEYINRIIKEKFSLNLYHCREEENPYEVLTLHFGTKNLKGFGIERLPAAVQAAGNLMSYLKETQKSQLCHITKITHYNLSRFMRLDENTIRNLEIFYTIYNSKREGTLLSVIDKTQTSMGGRLMRSFLLKPLIDKKEIEERISAVEKIFKDYMMRRELKKLLGKILDIERIASRIICNRGNARDMLALSRSLQALPKIKKILEKTDRKKLMEIRKSLDSGLNKLISLIEKSVADDPPITIKEGGIIKKGFNEDLDKLYDLVAGGEKYLKNYEKKIREETGIPSIKVSFNKVFGYYLEVTKTHADKVPETFVRKQTLVNAERFITTELKKHEDEVLGAEEKIKEIEYKIFLDLRDKVGSFIKSIKEASQAVALIDVFASFAEIAETQNFVKPEISNGYSIEIAGGRHPSVEAQENIDFIPNDIILNESRRMLLVTGPNMSGKSTYLRQTALICLLAQIGSFVPARKAKISIVDRIFTRIGASDVLPQGQSTFMVEMQEAADILNNATSRSLLILDEIGRGTSTYDGLAIAWAIFEYLHNKVKAKTLFATHYHEMIELAENLEYSNNISVAVTEGSSGVVFLHKITEGGADKSYGTHVASIAGLPNEVVSRAEKILARLEKSEEKKEIADPKQMSFFSMKTPKKNIEKKSCIENELESLDVNKLTPVQAIIKLSNLKKKLKDRLPNGI